MNYPHKFKQLIISAALSCLALSAHAEINLGEVAMMANDAETSPIPQGLVVGGVSLAYNARYEGQANQVWLIPGFIYFGEQLMFLGDRARYYLHKDQNLGVYAYGRVRVGNLNPADTPELAGMKKRQWQLEGGVGANWITPYAMITARVASDITGTSNGQEALLWADFPLVRDRLLIMPGMGVMWRSSNMANYYFGGVSAAEASATRAQHDTGATLSPMAALITSYRFNKNWLGMAVLNIEHFDADIANSPIVQHQNEFTFLAGVGYTW